MKLSVERSLPLGRRSLPSRVAMDVIGTVIAAAILVFFGVYYWAERDARETVKHFLYKIQTEVSVVKSGESVVQCGNLNKPTLAIRPPRGVPQVIGKWWEGAHQIAYLQCGNEILWIGHSRTTQDGDKLTKEELSRLAPLDRKSAIPREDRSISTQDLVSKPMLVEWVASTDFGSMWRGQSTFRLEPNEEVELTVNFISLGARFRIPIWSLWGTILLPLISLLILVGNVISYAVLRRTRSLTRLCGEIDELRDRKRTTLSRANSDPNEIVQIVDLFNEYLRVQHTWESTQRKQLGNLKQLLDEVRNGERASRHAIGKMLDGILSVSDAGTDSGTARKVRQLKDLLSYQLDVGSIRFRCNKLQTATDPTRAELVGGFKNLLKEKRNIEFDFVPRFSEKGLRVWVDKIDLQEMLACLVYNAEEHSGQGTTRVQVVVERAGDKVRLSVEDDGKGFPEDQYMIGQLTNWLCKGEGSNGLGIGLAYVFDAATACGGKLQLGTSEALGGARSTIELPLNKPSFGAV